MTDRAETEPAGTRRECITFYWTEIRDGETGAVIEAIPHGDHVMHSPTEFTMHHEIYTEAQHERAE